ncbi:MAG: phosphogluconate dehydrogenase (NAD(+)-dependent, decarboxylating) [Acidimicrobiia bacterium]
MKIGMVGLGRMGANMAKRLVDRGHEVVGFDPNPATVSAAAADGAEAAASLDALVAALPRPRVVWLMVPSGEPTESTIAALGGLLDAGDTIVDGGNSRYRNAQRWSAELAPSGIGVVDAGVSGGVWGLELGYCLMVGGADESVAALRPVLEALAPADGFAHVGPSGAGHYAKMVHNGVEYGLLQAYAEGFALLDAAPELIGDVHQLAALWNHGSVVRSWLLELAELALAEPAEFGRIKGYVEDSGEGRWTVDESTARSVATPVITASLYARFSSRQPDSYAARIVAALRNQFGGHKFFEEAGGARAAEAAEPPGSSMVAGHGGDTGSVRP